ncbi:MAG TPA: heterodisulfide reductase-related iron-sulfur binding cluster, partial [Stellaceae bacterium]|nr:heterodisulfide reductase-related iron-sulfur binding cluster [Stellaceae bacterium]
SLREELVGHLPRYAPWASRFGWLLNLRDRVPGLATLSEKLLGFSARRKLPRWHKQPFQDMAGSGSGREVVLFADTFNRWFEPENARAAWRVLDRAGYRVASPLPPGVPASAMRPLCCGRTFLSVGMIEQAKEEAQRTIAALKPFVERGVPVIGLEPSCLLTLRDEFPGLVPGEDAKALAKQAVLFEEFIAAEKAAGRFDLKFKPLKAKAVLHTHCHQKAFGIAGASATALKLIPGLEVESFDSTCCGMAGAFGYEAEHYDMSMKIGELGVLPKMRAASPDAILAATGTSCRCQIQGGTGRLAAHPAVILDRASS